MLTFPLLIIYLGIMIYRDHFQKVKKFQGLKTWNELGYLPRKYNKNRLTQTDTSISKAHGRAKVHKENCPFRPVISTVGSPIYMLTTTLFHHLSYCLDKPKS